VKNHAREGGLNRGKAREGTGRRRRGGEGPPPPSPPRHHARAAGAEAGARLDHDHLAAGERERRGGVPAGSGEEGRCGGRIRPDPRKRGGAAAGERERRGRGSGRRGRRGGAGKEEGPGARIWREGGGAVRERRTAGEL